MVVAPGAETELRAGPALPAELTNIMPCARVREVARSTMRPLTAEGGVGDWGLRLGLGGEGEGESEGEGEGEGGG